MRERLPLPLRPHIPIFSPDWIVILMPRRIGLLECVKDAERSLSSTCPVAGQSSVTDRVSQERFSLGVTSAKVFRRPYEDSKQPRMLCISRGTPERINVGTGFRHCCVPIVAM